LISGVFWTTGGKWLSGVGLTVPEREVETISTGGSLADGLPHPTSSENSKGKEREVQLDDGLGDRYCWHEGKEGVLVEQRAKLPKKRIRDFAIDPGQDLIVMVEDDPEPYVHFLLSISF
jgi:hypothetical protein